MDIIATLGDKTSHGGLIITASRTRKVRGQFVARLGDKCTCPVHGSTIITVVTAKMPVTDGLPTAHSGAKTACGAMLLKTPNRDQQGSGQ